MKIKFHTGKSATAKWFTVIFLSFSLVLLLVLVPLYLYLQHTFSALELEKSNKQLSIGTAQLDAVTTGMLNISQTLSKDSRFLVFRYADPDYSTVDVVTQNQMRNTLSGLIASQPLVKDSALQFDKDVAITPYAVFFQGRTPYYPDFFQCDSLENPQWIRLLQENGTGFLPVCKIRSGARQYEALIYTLRWTEEAYLYACVDIAELKKALVPNPSPNTSYLTLRRSNGDLLFSDLPEGETGYHTIFSSTSVGKLEIEVHIPNAVFTEKMSPLYFFLLAYSLICLLFFILWALLGSHISAKPISRITRILEKSRHLIPEASPSPTGKNTGWWASLWRDFDQISNSITIADLNIDRYRSMIDTQHELLSLHFFEKAIHGQLGSQNDFQQFYSHFPNFPEEYRLLLLKLYAASPGAKPDFSEELLTVQAFLQSTIPAAYVQRSGSAELLLLIPASDYETCGKILNLLTANVNQHEPLLMLRCMASDVFRQPEDLSHAYYQLWDLECCSFAAGGARICTTEDYADISKSSPSFYMVDLQTMYTAISFGNESAALSKLEECSSRLEDLDAPVLLRHIHELIRSMLVCVRLEHPEARLSADIPDYRIQETLFSQLSPVVRSFCKEISAQIPSETDRFAAELIQYMDQHFTEYDLCLDSLGKHFNCSASKLQKTVKSATGATIANYIEERRMGLASELLARKQSSVTQIAEQCGYASVNTFSKAFKRFYGRPPTEEAEPLGE